MYAGASRVEGWTDSPQPRFAEAEARYCPRSAGTACTWGLVVSCRGTSSPQPPLRGGLRLAAVPAPRGVLHIAKVVNFTCKSRGRGWSSPLSSSPRCGGSPRRNRGLVRRPRSADAPEVETGPIRPLRGVAESRRPTSSALPVVQNIKRPAAGDTGRFRLRRCENPRG